MGVAAPPAGHNTMSSHIIAILLLLSLTPALLDGQRRWTATRRSKTPTSTYRRRYSSRNNNDYQIKRGRTQFSSGYQNDYTSFRSSLEGLPNFFILRGGTFY